MNESDNCGNQDQQGGEVDMAGSGSDRTSKARRLHGVKVAAAVIALLLIGVMASSALADGDPFSAITAITGSTTSSDTTDTSSTSSDTTATSTDATTDATTSTDSTTTTDAATTDATTSTDVTTTAE